VLVQPPVQDFYDTDVLSATDRARAGNWHRKRLFAHRMTEAPQAAPARDAGIQIIYQQSKAGQEIRGWETRRRMLLALSQEKTPTRFLILRFPFQPFEESFLSFPDPFRILSGHPYESLWCSNEGDLPSLVA
jgi:hypothetical protein